MVPGLLARSLAHSFVGLAVDVCRFVCSVLRKLRLRGLRWILLFELSKLLVVFDMRQLLTVQQLRRRLQLMRIMRHVRVLRTVVRLRLKLRLLVV